jgi:hypothetical protein
MLHVGHVFTIERAYLEGALKEHSMKKALALALLLATVAGSAASAYPHHRAQVCSFRHHHRVCHWR